MCACGCCSDTWARRAAAEEGEAQEEVERGLQNLSTAEDEPSTAADDAHMNGGEGTAAAPPAADAAEEADGKAGQAEEDDAGKMEHAEEPAAAKESIEEAQPAEEAAAEAAKAAEGI